MSLELATEADIPAIMAIERIPDYALFIGSFSEDEHRAYMASPDARYLVWREDGEVAAFASSGVRTARWRPSSSCSS